jgi:ribosomal protein S6--L-glutamate ligase
MRRERTVGAARGSDPGAGPTPLFRDRFSGRKKLLLVADDPRIRDVMVRGLSPMGVDVTVAEDGHVGLFLASTEAFDAVIVDLDLPDTPGERLLRVLRSECPSTPVIVVAAGDEPGAREAAIGAGASEYLTKPFMFEDLCGRLEASFPKRSRCASPRMWVLTDRRYLQQRMPRALVSWLEAQGHAVRLVVADEGPQLSLLAPDEPTVSVWADLEPEDLVIARSRHPFALALLREAESRGASTVVTWTAIQRVRNKVRAALTLREHGLPTPETFVASRPADLARVRRSQFPLVLKPFQGDNARGIRLVRTPEELRLIDWHEALVVGQRYVDAGDVDLKLYVAGQRVWAVRRPSPLSSRKRRAVRKRVDETLNRLALSCAAAFELPLAGVDVIEGPDGPVIVDVNEFPNYTGIVEGPEVIGRLLLSRTSAAAAVGLSP